MHVVGTVRGDQSGPRDDMRGGVECQKNPFLTICGTTFL